MFYRDAKVPTETPSSDLPLSGQRSNIKLLQIKVTALEVKVKYWTSTATKVTMVFKTYSHNSLTYSCKECWKNYWLSEFCVKHFI